YFQISAAVQSETHGLLQLQIPPPRKSRWLKPKILSKKHQLPCRLFITEFVLIQFDTFQYDLLRPLAAESSVHDNTLFLQGFVAFEELYNFLHDMRSELFYVVDMVVGRIVLSDSDNFIILLTAINHVHDTYNFCFYQGHR